MPTNAVIAAAVAPVIESFAVNITNAAVAPPTWYAINAAVAPSEAEVRIYDAIGAWGITADQFVSDLKKIDAQTIHVRLNTPGGAVFDGTAIHNALIEHPANIVVHVDGVAASAGSFIAMAGDEIRMADNTYMMIHNARGGAMGEADDMRRYADLLDKMNGVIAGMYERKTGKPRGHWQALMDAETWFTANEAKAEGLADVVEPATKAAPAKPAKAAFDYTIYNKIPDAVQQMWGIAKTKTSAVAPAPTLTETSAGNQSAPEASTSVEAATHPLPKETTMETENVVAPAQSAAATDPKPDINSIDGLRQLTAQQYYNNGIAEGRKLERAAQQDLMRNIVAASPGEPDIALSAFMTGQSPESVKLAFDAKQTAKRDANARIAAMELEHERKIALAVAGGHPGVNLGVTGGNDQNVITFAPDTPPETQAKMEWDANFQNCRNTGASEKQYILARSASLSGRVNAFKKA